MKKDITKLRYEIYNTLKTKALSYEVGSNAELSYYRQSQEAVWDLPFEESNIDEVLAKALDANLIYMGDFHTFDQNIRNVLRILRSIIDSKEECCIALEMINSSFQYYVDSFMEGHLTELEFLEMIKYHQSWRFPWTHYKLIFDIAKRHNIKIIAINTDGGLDQRDEFAANLLSQYHKDNPTIKILLLYGEYHIVSDKIPAKVKKRIPNIKDLIIHQNLDGIYWKQIESKNDSKFVRFNDNEFCINSAPPWIKYESMIYWYENLCDDPDFDIHEYIIENGTKIFTSDSHENFLAICKQIVNALQLEISEDIIEDFNLYDHTSLEYITMLVDELEEENASNLFEQLLTKGYSFRLPTKKTFYCSSYSLNRIAYLAGIHIFFSSLSDPDNLEIYKNSKKKDFFHMSQGQYIFAYFFSKVINPHRKCAMYQDLKVLSDKDFLIIKDSILNYIDHSTFNYKDHTHIELIEISQFTGHLIGEYLYQALFNLKLDINIKDFLSTLDANIVNLDILKNQILSLFDYRNDKKRYF